MKFKGFHIRLDGRVELICGCGIGHPSKKLTLINRGYYDELDDIHGCCGDCWDESFKEAEEKYAEELTKKGDERKK